MSDIPLFTHEQATAFAQRFKGRVAVFVEQHIFRYFDFVLSNRTDPRIAKTFDKWVEADKQFQQENFDELYALSRRI